MHFDIFISFLRLFEGTGSSSLFWIVVNHAFLEQLPPESSRNLPLIFNNRKERTLPHQPYVHISHQFLGKLLDTPGLLSRNSILN